MSEKFKDNVPPESHTEQEPKIKYQLLFNGSAGEYKVNHWSDDDIEDWENSGYRTNDGHFSEVGLYDTEADLNRAIDDLRGPDKFVVYKHRLGGELTLRVENNLTGNWHGSRDGGDTTILGEFDTQDKADEFIRNQK